MLRPEEGKSLGDTIRHIQPPANVLIAAHGGEGSNFNWHQDENISYADAFQRLPAGTQSVIAMGCYGESARQAGYALPPGTVLYGSTGERIVGAGGEDSNLSHLADAIAQINGPLSTTSMILKGMDTIDVGLMVDAYAAFQDQSLPNAPKSLYDMLAHTVTIGGNPPVTLTFQEVAANIGELAKAGQLDDQALDRAVELASRECPTMNASKRTSFQKVADKMRAGVDPSRMLLDEKRMVDALSAAYLETSGTLQTIVLRQQSAAPVKNQVTMEWDQEKGSVGIARLQSMMEVGLHIATDAGGANDHRVSGQVDDTMKAAVAKAEAHYGIDPQTDINDAMPQIWSKMRHDPELIKTLGAIQDWKGDTVANAPQLARPQAERDNGAGR